MKLSGRTIRQLTQIVTGDSKVSPYRSGSDLVQLFNEFGANDVYGQGFPTRWRYAEEKISAMIGTPNFARFITHVFDPREFLGTAFQPEKAVEHINEYLKFDGVQIVKDGAITNARSLVEAVLTELERNFDPNASPYDGDLPKLYRRVQKHLSLDPARPDIADTLKQILSGLTSIVSGLAGMRNKMSDAHAQNYRPKKHLAKLAVNAAKTLADFLFETNQFQAAGTN